MLTDCRVPKKPDHAINIPSRELVERSIRVEGSLMGGWDTSYQVMEYIRQGRIRPILNEVGLADVPRVMASLKSCQSVGKTVVMLDG